ncbi:MAG TPA: hypothetical protein VE963_19250 [Reyranella sp.]|nr:hypothetical protein [Reyranella sp.]
MPKRTLTEFLDTHRAGAHLVAGVPPKSHGDENLRTQARKLVRAVEFGKPGGDYAVGVVRETGRPELYCAFADPADAQSFAEFVGARPSADNGAWASRQVFALDHRTLTNLDRTIEGRRRPAGPAGPGL